MLAMKKKKDLPTTKNHHLLLSLKMSTFSYSFTDTFTHSYYRPKKKKLHTEYEVCAVLKDACHAVVLYLSTSYAVLYSHMFIIATLFSPLLPWICYSYGNWRSLWMASGSTAKDSLNLSLPIPFKLTDKSYQQNS